MPVKLKASEQSIIGFGIALLLVTVLAVTAAVAYTTITDRIIQSAIANMEELALHDERAIESSLDYYWDILDGIARNLRLQKVDSVSDMLLRLNADKSLLDCIRLLLIAENGDTLSSNMTTSHSNTLLEITHSASKRFILRQDYVEIEGRSEVLVLGVSIEPLTVEANTYTHLVCLMDIDTLQNELKIDSFGGRGYSSVIDLDGNYIVKLDRSHTRRDNFFELIAQGSLGDGYTADTVRSHIQNGETFSLIHYRYDGDARILSFTPMPDVDWYFIMAVSRSVFEEQSFSLIRIFMLMLALALGTIVVATIVVMQRRAKLLALEVEHREELKKALTLAEQANRAKTVFLSNMSHDIRTPMNAIIGFTRLAMQHLDERERVRDYLAKTDQASSHLLSLINDVLDMSRIESGKVIIDEKPENLAAIVHDLCDIIQTDIRSKQLDLFIDTVGITDERVICDRLQLNRILLNLLSNSMKFTPAGGTISLQIAQRPASREGYAAYEFRVRDTGIGMSPEFLDTIFEPFTRERTSTVSGIAGTGLGMSITKNIVDMMGGKITVASEVGKGTEFVVSLEFRLQGDQSGAGNAPLKQPALPEEGPDFTGCRILLVEDNEFNREISTELLEEVGFSIESAENGQIACDMLAASQPGYYDLILMDVQMPVMDGYQATRRIRAMENRALASIPILAMTANAFEEDKRSALEAGMNGHLGKPIDVPTLIKTLKQLLKK